MSSEVGTSLGISGSRKIQRFLDSARNDKAEEAARPLFMALTVYHDTTPHAAAMNMAIDEALLESATVPSIRFYGWQSPALSFGYFGRFSDVAIHATKRDLVRRWTGGGIVFHGEDLTYAIVIPETDPGFNESSITVYEKIHRALADTLIVNGEPAKLLPTGALGERGQSRTVIASGESCFANPVRADVMIDGRKIAGAAQRRTRRGLLQQGSIQGVNLDNHMADRFAKALSPNCSRLKIKEEIFRRAQNLAQQKYGTDNWLHKR
jgi:lipoate-protein ligase A